MKIQLLMSPVMQATGRRIVHTWVRLHVYEYWLHLMFTFTYSGEPLQAYRISKFTTVLRGPVGVGVLRLIPWGFSPFRHLAK